MFEYVLPIAIFLGFGAISGILLLVASKVLTIKKDETAEQISEALPGANCGGCGYSGCEAYANAIANSGAPINLCKPGGAKSLKAIGAILGEDTGEFIKEVAFVRCNGNCNATTEKYTYTGTQTCAALERFYNGKSSCRFGCAGFGDCVNVCDNNAISIVNGVAVVTPVLCTGCGKCVAACPNKLITLRKETQTIAVRCASNDPGKITRASCKNGCIGCKLCEKKCPTGAITVADNNAFIDSSKCTACGVCAAACPSKCIISLPSCITQE